MNAGDLTHVGLVIEQHPERTRLFMQWKQMDWAFMVDPFNLLNMRLVPCTLAIDEHGIIQAVQPRLDHAEEFIDLFVYGDFEAPDPDVLAEKIVTRTDLPSDTDTASLSELAISLTLWSDDSRLNLAVDVSQQALLAHGNARTHFNLGVIYRKRYDSPYRQEGDFSRAVEHWTSALNHDPNNYIWRRRLQQYGPRLDKPYPFYDWVLQARDDIKARGEVPIALTIEPDGAEFAEPLKTFDTHATIENPDPDNRIYQDTEPLIKAETVVVPPRIVAGESVRVHVTLRPSAEAHWNNEVDDTCLWIEPPAGWHADQKMLTVANSDSDTSNESKHFEFELKTSAKTSVGQHEVAVYSLYYICEDINGICLYRRRDFAIPIEILPSDGRKLKDGG